MDHEHSSTLTEAGNNHESGFATSPVVNHTEDMGDDFSDPIIIHLARNKSYCKCRGKHQEAVFESDVDSPSVVVDLEATPAEKAIMAHVLCAPQTPVDASSSAPQSPESSFDSEQFYTPEISQEIFLNQSPKSADENEEQPDEQKINVILSCDNHHGDGLTLTTMESASEASEKNEASDSLTSKANQDSPSVSTTDNIDDLEVYWKQAHQRLVSTILDIPSDVFDPFMPQPLDEALNLPDETPQFCLAVPPKYRDTSQDSQESPLNAKSQATSAEPISLASLWIPPSTSHSLPHTPERPNWALAPDEISPTPPKSTGSQRRLKSRSDKPERQTKDTKRWLTPSPNDIPRILNTQNIHRHLDEPDAKPEPDEAPRGDLARRSPNNSIPNPVTPSASPPHAPGKHPQRSSTGKTEVASQSEPPPPVTATSSSKDVPASNLDFFHERHAELLRQNHALVALLQSHYQYSIDSLSSPHQTLQHVRESPPLENSPAEVHHAMGPNIDEKGFQRPRTTVSPSRNSDHKLKRRASWRKSVSLPTIAEAPVGSVPGTPSYHPINVEHVNVPCPTFYKILSSQDPNPCKHDVSQKDDTLDICNIQLKPSQIKWPTRSEEASFHESAHPTVSWHDRGSGGDEGPSNIPTTSVASQSTFNRRRMDKAADLEGLADNSPDNTRQYIIPLEDDRAANWHMPRSIENMRTERMVEDQTMMDTHPKGRDDSSHSSSLASSIPIAVRLQRKSSLTNQHANESQRSGGFVPPSGYASSSGYESRAPQTQSSWPPRLGPGSTKITSDWRQQTPRGSSPQELRGTPVTVVDHIAKPVVRTRSLQGLNQQADAAASTSPAASTSTVTRSRFAAPPQGSLHLVQAGNTDLAPVHAQASSVTKRVKPEQRLDFNSRRSDSAGSRERGDDDSARGPHSRRFKGAMKRIPGSTSRPSGHASNHNSAGGQD